MNPNRISTTVADQLPAKSLAALLAFQKKAPSEITEPMNCKQYFNEIIKNNRRIYKKFGTTIRPGSGLKLVS